MYRHIIALRPLGRRKKPRICPLCEKHVTGRRLHKCTGVDKYTEDEASKLLFATGWVWGFTSAQWQARDEQVRAQWEENDRQARLAQMKTLVT